MYHFSQENAIEKELEWTDKVTYEVPNVIGKTVEEAKKLLSNFTIEYSSSGDIVAEQTPSPGEKLEDMGVVRLLLK